MEAFRASCTLRYPRFCEPRALVLLSGPRGPLQPRWIAPKARRHRLLTPFVQPALGCVSEKVSCDFGGLGVLVVRSERVRGGWRAAKTGTPTSFRSVCALDGLLRARGGAAAASGIPESKSRSLPSCARNPPHTLLLCVSLLCRPPRPDLETFRFAQSARVASRVLAARPRGVHVVLAHVTVQTSGFWSSPLGARALGRSTLCICAEQDMHARGRCHCTKCIRQALRPSPGPRSDGVGGVGSSHATTPTSAHASCGTRLLSIPGPRALTAGNIGGPACHR